MRKTISMILIVLALLFVTACTNDISAPDDSWADVFLQYWDAMNTEYVHFDTDKDTDWDAVYDEYLPKFQALDYTNAEDSLTAFRYFKEISINIDDYHFNLQVNDAFGSSLSLSPARERKWWEKEKTNSGTERTIMSYPDVLWVDSNYGVKVMLSVDKKTTISAANINDIYEFLYAVEGAEEISSLRKNNTLHNNGSTSFSVEKKSDDNLKVTQPDKGASAQEIAWYSVVNGLGLKDFVYDYGVTTDGIFYFYISQFVSTPNEPLLYEKDLNAAQKKKLEDEGLLQLHGIIWCIPEEAPTLNEFPGITETLTDEQRGWLKNVTDLFQILMSIGKTGTCTIDNNPYTINGVIMDVRSNGGGSVTTLETILGCFFKESIEFAKVRYKDGYSRFEFTPWVGFSMEKEYCNGVRDYDKPFAILANGSSVSCSELSSSIVKNLMAKGALIGAQTYGGTCGLTDRNIYHSGPFKSNSLSVYTTTYETLLKVKEEDGTYSYKDLEGIGVTPTVSVDVDSTYAKDKRFEEAVKWINNNN